MVRIKTLFLSIILGIVLGISAGSYAKTQDLEAHDIAGEPTNSQ